MYLGGLVQKPFLATLRLGGSAFKDGHSMSKNSGASLNAKPPSRKGAKFHCAIVAAIRRGSNRQTLPARILDSHTEPRPTLIESPPSPANCCTTLFTVGSIREIGNSKEVTQ